MPIAAREFLESSKRVKAFLSRHDDLSPQLLEAWDRVQEAFRLAYTSEDFKEALAENAQIPDDLEERMTSTLVLLHREADRVARRTRDD